MFHCLRFVLIAIFIIHTAIKVHASDCPDESRQEAVKASGSDKKVRQKRSLLSALMLLNLTVPGRQMLSSESILSLQDRAGKGPADGLTGYPLSFLRTAEMKETAVEELYKKHGYNHAVRWSLRSFSKHKYSFQERLVRSGKYVGSMADIFSDEGLPRELIFLPLIESQFNPYAYSRSRAAGPWQFMPATARRLDLKIDWWVDERRDPIKSTKAAASYLKYLYERFGSWNLALAAYNGGESRIGRALKYTGKRDFWTLRKTGYIARETKNYVPSFIAATAIAIHPENFGFESINYEEPLRYDEVVVKNPMDLEVAARFAGVSTMDIRDLNPELRRLCTPPNVQDYKLRVPRGTKRKFLENLTKTRGSEKFYINLYTVQSGDTVKKIAEQLGSTIQAIIDMNALGARALIKAGKKILVPIEENWDKLVHRAGY